MDQQIDDDKIVAALYKYGGAFSLVGLEFYYRPKEDAPELRIRLDGPQRDGESYRATDVRANKALEDSFHPSELTMMKASRGRRDPVTLLMMRLRINPEEYIDPLGDRPSTRLGDYSTPEAQFGMHAKKRRPPNHQLFGEQGRGFHAGGLQGLAGRGRSFTPMQRTMMTPPLQRNPFQFGQPAGQGYQQGFRPVPVRAFSPRMQMGAGMGNQFQQPENDEDFMHSPIRGQRREGFEGSGETLAMIPYRQQYREEGMGRDPLEVITSRLAALEESRQIERERGAMSTELRRMQERFCFLITRAFMSISTRW
jgi:hypothetical protein